MGPNTASKPSRSTRGKVVAIKTARPRRDSTCRDALPSLCDTTTGPQKPRIPGEHNYEIRRILAERQCGEDTYYLLDWYPSWQLKGRTLKEVQKEWDANKMDNEHTFEHDGDIKLLSTNPTQDDADERVRQMLEAVAEQFLAHIGRGKSKEYIDVPIEVATKLFHEKDWTFVHGHNECADDIARGRDEELPCAAEVMRRAYIELRSKKSPRSIDTDNLIWSTIEVRFMGEVDPNMSGEKGRHSRRAGNPYSFIAPLFAQPIFSLHPRKWLHSSELHALKPSIEAIVTDAPYILRDPLSMMFIRFFFGANKLAKSLEKVAVDMAKDWEERTRSEFLYEYMRCFGKWEKRTVDNVQMTYFHARMLVEDGGKGEESDESSASEEEGEIDGDEDSMDVYEEE